MNTLDLLRNIDNQIACLKKAQNEYDPGAGLTIYIERHNAAPLQLGLADGVEVMDTMMDSLIAQRQRALGLARMEMKDLAKYLGEEQ